MVTAGRICDAPDCRRALPRGRRRFCSDVCARYSGRPPHQCEAPGCGTVVPIGRRRFCSDLCAQRGQRAERTYDTGELGRGTINMVRRMARVVGGNDIAEYGLMWRMISEAEAAAVLATGRLRAAGFSWTELARETGLTRQGLAQWYARNTAEGDAEVGAEEVPR